MSEIFLCMSSLYYNGTLDLYLQNNNDNDAQYSYIKSKYLVHHEIFMGMNDTYLHMYEMYRLSDEIYFYT